MWKPQPLHRLVETLALCLVSLSLWPSLPLAAQTHHYVYLASSTDSHNISGVEVSQSNGTLTGLHGSPFSESNLPSEVTFDPIDLAFDPAGRFLFALDRDNSAVSAFSVDPSTGTLSEIAGSPFAVGGGFSPKFIKVDFSGGYLYVVSEQTDIISGIFTRVSYYSIADTGALRIFDSTSPVSLSSIGFLYKPQDKFMYVVGADSSNRTQVLTLQLDPSSGQLANVSPNPKLTAAAGSLPTSTTLAPGGSILLIGRGATLGFIDAYPLAADGWMGQSLLTPASTAQVPGIPFSLAMDYSGGYLYAALGKIGLAGYSVNSSDGALTPLSGSPFIPPPAAPTDVLEADPVAQFADLYFNKQVFSISATGALTALAAPVSGVGIVSAIAAASPKDAPITGPVLSLSTFALQFPQQTVGTLSAPQPVTFSNTGIAPLLLSAISAAGDNSSDFAVDNECPASLDPNDSCTVNVSFLPRAAGSRVAAISIADNAPGNPHMVALTGTAAASTNPIDPINPISGPVVSLSTTSVSFATQSIGAAASSKTVKLSNIGNGTLLLSGISLSGANASEFKLDYDCLAAVLASAGCTVTINFQPQFPGTRAAVLNILDNAPGAPHTIALSGSAQIPFSFSADIAQGSVSAGQSAQFMLRLTPAAGFIGRVALSCSGLPDQSACDLPAAVDSNGASPIVFAVTVSTTPRSSAAPSWRRAPPSLRWEFETLYNFAEIVALAALFAALFFILLARGMPFKTRHGLPQIATACACVLLVFALVLTGCGATGANAIGSSSSTPVTSTTPTSTPSPTPSNGTPAGQYSLAITATFGSVTQTVPLTLSVT